MSTPLGNIVPVVDSRNQYVPISFKSDKVRRVVRSTIPGEVISFSDMFDVSVNLID